MTDKEWGNIAEAWARWIQGIGPPVQGRVCVNSQTSRWQDWVSTGHLDRSQYDEWRVKPRKKLVRFILTGEEHVSLARKLEGDSDPDTVGDTRYFGEWTEVPS